MPLSIPVSSDSKCLFTFLHIFCSSDFSHNTLFLCLVILFRMSGDYFHICLLCEIFAWVLVSVYRVLCSSWHSLVFKCLVIFLILCSYLCLKTPSSAVCGSRLSSHALGRGASMFLDRVCSGAGSSSSGRACHPTWRLPAAWGLACLLDTNSLAWRQTLTGMFSTGKGVGAAGQRILGKWFPR